MVSASAIALITFARPGAFQPRRFWSVAAAFGSLKGTSNGISEETPSGSGKPSGGLKPVATKNPETKRNGVP
jgi:hypothetical protein